MKTLKLIEDAKRVAFVGYSSWAFYALALVTIAPDVIYLAAGVDTNPAVWSIAQLAVIVFGIMGRLVDQVPDGRWVRRISVLLLVAIFALMAAPSFAMSAWPNKSAPVADHTAGEPTWLQTAEVLTPLVAKWEGKRNTAYADLVGVPTICYGHTRTVTRADVDRGTTWSNQRCEELLRAELHEYWSETRRGFAPETIANRLTPERDAAYASLSFNVGWGGVRGSTATRRLNDGDVAGGCEALTWWNKAGGRVVRGLVNRRTEERNLCMVGLA